MKKSSIFFLLILCICTRTLASPVDTILVHSMAMNKDIKCVIITPANKPAPGTHWPVVYLLHGYSGNYAQWIQTAPQLSREATEYGILFVCPDGGYDSWYFDSPIDPSIRYETFITHELIPYIDHQYPTFGDKTHRAITGLSMGGHGALYLAIRHRDLFGAAGATSGGVDFRPFPNNWGIKKDLGDYDTHQAGWEAHTVIHAVDDLHNGELKIIFDCGIDDFFLAVNRALHQKLVEQKINHDYIERPGGHDGAYWRNSIDYQVLFFNKYFR
ncbi:alpha/beta hydrolase [Puia dinghuensis]|uniref:Esterase n=1 Tax=Puia dinghuensis TaxID=1792502 RepID=A0A8J2UAM2_9BACT|nr:alpha/beta hydrolase family protein [Puia dinghuensis]GGA90956.1 esterase [Puia dinghuensis]